MRQVLTSWLFLTPIPIFLAPETSRSASFEPHKLAAHGGVNCFVFLIFFVFVLFLLLETKLQPTDHLCKIREKLKKGDKRLQMTIRSMQTEQWKLGNHSV